MAWNPGISWGSSQNPGDMSGLSQAGYGALNSEQQAYYQHQQSLEWQAYQKQLSQWQSQYGEQYAMQMQNSGAPPPPPPEPVDKPPEPPTDSPNKSNLSNQNRNPSNQGGNQSNRGGNNSNRGGNQSNRGGNQSNRGGNQSNRGGNRGTQSNSGNRNFQEDNISVKSNNSGNSGNQWNQGRGKNNNQTSRGGNNQRRGNNQNQNQQQNDNSNSSGQDQQNNSNRGSRGGNNNNNNQRGRGGNNNNRGNNTNKKNQKGDQDDIPSLLTLYNKGVFGESNLLGLKKADLNQQGSSQQNKQESSQQNQQGSNQQGSNQQNWSGRGNNNNQNEGRSDQQNDNYSDNKPNQSWVNNNKGPNRGGNNNQRGRGGNNNNIQQNDQGNNSNNWQGNRGSNQNNSNTSNNSNQGGFNQGQQNNNQNRQGNKRNNSGGRSNNSNDNWQGNQGSRDQNSGGWNQNSNNNSGNWNDGQGSNQGNWNNDQNPKANIPPAHNWNEKSPQIHPDKIPPGWSEKPADVPKEEFDPFKPSTSSPAKAAPIVIPEQKKTEEEILFDDQFKKWEESFYSWKAANVNHPDKATYRDYEMKFEEMKEKLLKRKEAMNKKKEEEALELMKKKMEAEAIIQQVEATRAPKIHIQSVQVIAPVDQKMDFNIKNMETHNKTNVKKSNTSAIQGWLSKSSTGIPGLDLVPDKEKIVQDEKLDDDVTEVINLVDDKPSNEKSFHDDQPSSSKKPRIEILDDVIISRDDPMDLEVPETEDTSLVAAPTNLTNDITQGLSQILSNPGLMALIASVSGQKGGDAQPGPSGNNSSAPDMSMQRHGTGNMKQMENKLGNQGNQNLMNQLNSGNQMGNQMNPRQGNFFQQDSQGNQNNRNNPNMMMNQQNNSNNQRNNQQFGNMNQNRNQFNDNNEQDDDNYQQDYDDEYPDEDPFQDQYDNDYDDNNPSSQNFNQNNSNNPASQNFNQNNSNNPNQPQIRSLLDFDPYGNQRNQQNPQNQNFQQNYQQNLMNPQNRFNQGPGNFQGNLGPQGNPMNPTNQMNQMNENPDPNDLQQYRMQNRVDPFFRPNQVIDYGNQKLPVTLLHDEKDLYKPNKVVEYAHRSTGLYDDYEFNPVVPEFCPARKIDYLHKGSSGVAPTTPWSKDELKQKPVKDSKYKTMAKPEETESRPDYPSKFILQSERPPTTNRRAKKITPKIQRIKDDIAKKLRKAQQGTEHLEDISSSESEIENEPDPEEKPRHSQPSVRIVLPSIRAQGSHQAPKQLFNIPFDKSSSEMVKLPPKVIMDIDKILAMPGRRIRPKKFVIILRGIPGSGKSHLAKLIKDKELAEGGSAPRILSIDDYFMSEVDEIKKCEKTGRNLPVRKIVYEFDAGSEDNYMHYLVKSYKKNLTDGMFNFIIVDCNCDSLKYYHMFSDAAKAQGFSIYVIELENNPDVCHKRNIHNRSLEDIEAVAKKFQKSPEDHQLLDASSLLFKKEEPKVLVEEVKPVELEKLETEEISDDEVEDNELPDGFEIVDEIGEDDSDEEEEIPKFDMFKTQSKWETTSTEESKARLDGISRPLKHDSIEDYLQMDGWEPTPSAKPGKKRVRWADIEEKREQEKMRAIGFVIGQDWNRVMDPTEGRSALTKTKYIERTRKN